MTSTEFKEEVRRKASASVYDLNTLKQEIIQGITQCLENQEKILDEIRTLNKNIKNNND